MVSCQKEYTPFNNISPIPPGGLPGVTGKFTAKVNGVLFTGDKFAGAIRNAGVINISGLANSGKAITITLTDSGAHIYQLNSQTINAAGYNEAANAFSFTSNGSNDPFLAGGTCTITNIDTAKKQMSGTFKFKVFREIDGLSRDITEGTFTSLSYSTDALPPTTNVTDTFRVKVDGVDWVNYSLNALAVPFLDKIAITTSEDANANINIGFTFAKTITTGSYQWDLFTVAGLYHPSSFSTTGSLLAEGGNLTILEHNTTTKRIRGTFNFLAAPITSPTPVVAFTEGYFSVVYR